VATGWLGWTPDYAWHTPIPQIMLALDYRIDWVKKTNPFGGGDDSGKSHKQSPEQIKSVLRGQGAKKVSG